MFGAHAARTQQANALGTGVDGTGEGGFELVGSEAEILGMLQIRLVTPVRANPETAHHGDVTGGLDLFFDHAVQPFQFFTIILIVIHGEEHIHRPLVPLLAHHVLGIGIGAREHVHAHFLAHLVHGAGDAVYEQGELVATELGPLGNQGRIGHLGDVDARLVIKGADAGSQ